MTTKTKHIEVMPYNPNWPEMFEGESANIQRALGETSQSHQARQFHWMMIWCFGL